ncbi:MAG: hypothetical protein H7Y59_11985 [Anaerolineales bacterium]|nr:hypothetical protein [Anaerolineales bacterium]
MFDQRPNNLFIKLKFTYILIALVFILSACGGQAATGATSYIATLEGAPASARVGIVVEDGVFKAYVCSLDDAFNLTSARWYEGQLDANGSFDLVSSDGVKLKGTIQAGQFTGTLTNIQGTSMTFNGTAVTSGAPAGLYRGTGQVDGQNVIVGAVISADGSFASTTQYEGQIKFVTPVGPEPVQLSENTLGINLGANGEQIPVTLVTTLK